MHKYSVSIILCLVFTVECRTHAVTVNGLILQSKCALIILVFGFQVSRFVTEQFFFVAVASVRYTT